MASFADFSSTSFLFTFSSLIVIGVFLWQGNKGFSLGDEGFLWYGVQRVLLGEVPIRDFMSYDIGRYYWSGAIMALWDDNGIMALRWSVAFFQIFGLFVALLTITRIGDDKQNIFYIPIASIVLMAWMYPRHKLFDISLSIFLVATLTSFAKSPTSCRFLFTGIITGLIAIFGRNHGLYGVIAFLGVTVWLSIKKEQDIDIIQGLFLWGTGIVLGFSPILLMLLFVPEFAEVFWESIRFHFEQGSTNLPLPVPWPWKIDFSSSVPLGTIIRNLLIGLFFIGIILFFLLSIQWIIWQKLNRKQVSPALVATSFLALPYAHFTYSRADVSHLAQGIFPLLIGCLIVLATQPIKIKWLGTILLCCASLWVMHIYHPGWQAYANRSYKSVIISGNKLSVHPRDADNILFLRQLVGEYAPKGQSFIAIPFVPGIYPLFERKAPTWETFPLFPRKKEFEHLEIERIKSAKPGFALVYDMALDGRDELRFRNTHPLINEYINRNFIRIPELSNNNRHVFKANKSQN
jgi:hypothetical protein